MISLGEILYCKSHLAKPGYVKRFLRNVPNSNRFGAQTVATITDSAISDRDYRTNAATTESPAPESHTTERAPKLFPCSRATFRVAGPLFRVAGLLTFRVAGLLTFPVAGLVFSLPPATSHSALRIPSHEPAYEISPSRERVVLHV